MGALAVRDLDLDLDAFEGPFDLLLTLVLKEELALAEVEIAEIVVTFVAAAARRGTGRGGAGLAPAELQVCGEFLVLVAALLELKARELFAEDDELDLEDFDPDEAVAELAERLAVYRRVKAGAAWLEERLEAESDRFFRARARPARAGAGAPARDTGPETCSRPRSGCSRPSRQRRRSRTLRSSCRRSCSSSSASGPRSGAGGISSSTRRSTVSRESSRRWPSSPSSSCARRERSVSASPRPSSRSASGRRRDGAAAVRGPLVDNPVDRVARTLEALLVVAPRPLSIEELAGAADADAERVETALGLLAGRYREGRSGIVLEHVAEGYAFRAAREAAAACGRLVERPVQRGLSQAALETMAIVAYLGPVSRPEIARIRGVAADSAVAGLLDRGLIGEAGRDGEGGAVRYRTTPLFERVFGLASLSELPALDDFEGNAEELRGRLEAVAEQRGA